jgi:hypothetical protein
VRFLQVDPDTARADAADILGGRKYENDPGPRPFRSQLEWIGDRLEPIFDWFADVFSAVPLAVWIVLALASIGLLLSVYVRRAERRAARLGRGGDGRRTASAIEDPNELERAAERAEKQGDYDLAVRLRFRAGLLRLGARKRIEYRPSVTTAEVRRALGSTDFDQLASTFEEIAYGGRDAVPPDVDEARTTWPRVYEAPPR